MTSWIRKLLPPRLIDGQVVPPDARVDPAGLPEDQFPVYCAKCRYLLRGLTSDRCPECGTPFDRGRLLVEQYVFSPERWQWSRSWKYAKWAMVIGYAPMAGFLIFACSMQFLVDPSTQPTISFDTMITIGRVMMVSMMAGVACSVVCVALLVRLAVVTKKKRLLVFKAIDKTSEVYQGAQKRKWVFTIVPLVGMAMFICFREMGNTGSRGYYAASPARILIPVAGAVAAGAIIFLGRKLWKRWEDRHDRSDM